MTYVVFAQMIVFSVWICLLIDSFLFSSVFEHNSTKTNPSFTLWDAYSFIIARVETAASLSLSVPPPHLRRVSAFVHMYRVTVEVGVYLDSCAWRLADWESTSLRCPPPPRPPPVTVAGQTSGRK